MIRSAGTSSRDVPATRSMVSSTDPSSASMTWPMCQPGAYFAQGYSWWARARNCRRASAPPDPRSGGTAADGHITQVCPNQSGFEIVSGPPAYSGYPANGRPPRRRDHIPARAPMPNRNVAGVPHSRLDHRGLPPSGSQHRNGCLHVVEYNGHGISPLAEEASSRYGATDRGRSSCPNQASHGSIRYASATRVRSNAPGRCSNCPKQRPTRLREYPSSYPHATSGHTALQ